MPTHHIDNVVASVDEIIDRAIAAGVAIDAGNVVDLLIDNLPNELSISDIRHALAASTFYGGKWPKAEKDRGILPGSTVVHS